MKVMNLLKTNTAKTGIVGILTGIGMIVAGDTATGIQTIIGGVAAIFLRNAMLKNSSVEASK